MRTRSVLLVRLVSDASMAVILAGVIGHALAELPFGPFSWSDLLPRPLLAFIFVLLAAAFVASPLLTLAMMLRRRCWNALAREADPDAFRRAAAVSVVIAALYLTGMSLMAGRVGWGPERVALVGVAVLVIPLYLMDCGRRLLALRRR